MIEGVDFAAGRPGGAALVAAGKKFVVRYVPYTIIVNGTATWVSKGLTAAEVADYRAHGIDMALVWESTANRALSGYAAGVADATTAKAAAARLGFPATCAIYFACDFDALVTEYPAIDGYLQGAASVLGLVRVGVYGHNRLVAHCRTAGTATWLWQTYAWSYGVIAAGIHLYQYLNGQTVAGSLVDLDRAYQANFGQWSAALSGGINIPGDNVPYVTIEKLAAPNPRLFTIPPNTLVNGYDPAQPNTIVNHFGPSPNASSASADALVTVAWPGIDPHPFPNGPNFLRVVNGGLAGLLIEGQLVTLDPAAPTGFTQADIDASNLAGFNDAKAKAEAAAQAAIGAIS
jgi:Rv2525c-like, glycoside hydrolase-like domain